jgi:hypothetical protein
LERQIVTLLNGLIVLVSSKVDGTGCRYSHGQLAGVQVPKPIFFLFGFGSSGIGRANLPACWNPSIELLICQQSNNLTINPSFSILSLLKISHAAVWHHW